MPRSTNLDEIQARGFDEFVRYVNPLLAQRAQLGGEPWHVTATDDGRLVTPEGRIIEDFHGTQALGHRNPHVTVAVMRYLQTDAPNWYPARVPPYVRPRWAGRRGGVPGRPRHRAQLRR